MIYQPFGDTIHDGRRRRQSMSHENHTFETHTDWDKETRVDADNRIKGEFSQWRKAILDKNYGEDEGHKSK